MSLKVEMTKEQLAMPRSRDHLRKVIPSLGKSQLRRCVLDCLDMIDSMDGELGQARAHAWEPALDAFEDEGLALHGTPEEVTSRVHTFFSRNRNTQTK